MISDDEYNAQGTFYFPAGFRNEAQYIAFWDSIPVPDEALESMMKHPTQLVHSQKRALRRQALATAQRARDLLKDLDKVQRARDWNSLEAIAHESERDAARYEDELAHRKADDPEEFLSRVTARPVARATGLVTYLPTDLDAATRKRILDHEFELGDGRTMNAGDIVERFQTLNDDFYGFLNLLNP